jgi:hypothetical protein
MRRRTGAVEASGNRILSLTVRFSPDHVMTPEPLLTASFLSNAYLRGLRALA